MRPCTALLNYANVSAGNWNRSRTAVKSIGRPSGLGWINPKKSNLGPPFTTTSNLMTPTVGWLQL